METQPIISKTATGLGTEAHLLATANKKRRQTYADLTSTIGKLQAELNNQYLVLTTVHKLQYMKVARRESPPLIIFSDKRKIWTATALRIILQAWQPAAKATRADKTLEHLRKTGHKRWEGIIQTEIWTAKTNKDWRTVWEHCRLLGGTHRGARKRNYQDVKRTDPSTEEWQTSMEAEGGDGGCLAEILSTWKEDPPSQKIH